MTDIIIEEPTIVGDIKTILDPIKGCINRNFCSSTLFLAPAIYGYLVNYSLVMWGSLICFLPAPPIIITKHRTRYYAE